MSNSEIGIRFGSAECAVLYVKNAAATLGNDTAPERKRGTGRNKKTQP